MSRLMSDPAYVQRYIHVDLLKPTGTAFGECLRKMRLAAGLSQTRLAARAGFNHSHMSRLESGSREPSPDMVVSLAEVMGLDASERDELLALAGFMPLDPVNYVRLVLADEPVVASLYCVLSDPRLDADHARVMRKMVEAVINGSEYTVATQANGRKDLNGGQEQIAAGSNGRHEA